MALIKGKQRYKTDTVCGFNISAENHQIKGKVSRNKFPFWYILVEAKIIAFFNTNMKIIQFKIARFNFNSSVVLLKYNYEKNVK